MLLPSQMICLGSSNSELPGGTCSVPEVQSPSKNSVFKMMGSDTSQKSNSRHEVTSFGTQSDNLSVQRL